MVVQSSAFYQLQKLLHHRFWRNSSTPLMTYQFPNYVLHTGNTNCYSLILLTRPHLVVTKLCWYSSEPVYQLQPYACKVIFYHCFPLKPTYINKLVILKVLRLLLMVSAMFYCQVFFSALSLLVLQGKTFSSSNKSGAS